VLPALRGAARAGQLLVVEELGNRTGAKPLFDQVEDAPDDGDLLGDRDELLVRRIEPQPRRPGAVPDTKFLAGGLLALSVRLGDLPALLLTLSCDRAACMTANMMSIMLAPFR
jgi:hypothetical protein